MIPDWFAVIDNAWEMLAPQGFLGVVDFYVSRKHPAKSMIRHGWWTRAFWPLWFGHDGVFRLIALLPPPVGVGGVVVVVFAFVHFYLDGQFADLDGHN